ncbi:MAG: SDR family oxidoreductase [Halioglobus sp.]|jgi:NAD(P)-dependent dehydrogenase (short-subunit alcohol dehydrogenase family)|nr:SDR family oxidoreductase [Halioglobus sp.]|tara:strand:+ start:44 stop:889 length:846 start_codon:yes stop_codon:yes gene_type:complete
MARFSGKGFVVTGGASGIGEATTRSLVAQGGRVVIADVQEDLGMALVAELGDGVRFKHMDVTNEAQIIAAIDLAVAEFGQLDGMVNNAGIIGAIGSIMDTSADDYDFTMSILSRGVFLGIKHAGRAMQPNGAGAIVSLASTAGVKGAEGPHVYTMAKHGVVGLTKSAASEFGAFGVRVNAVAPGGTVTPMKSALTDNDVELITKSIAADSPLGIACMPQDIANGIVFLLSEEARYISGHTLVIDGGLTTGGAASPFYSQEAEVMLHAGQRQSGSMQVQRSE